MATLGGLEIHEEMVHNAPEPSAGAASAAVPEPSPVADRYADVVPLTRPRAKGSRRAIPTLALAVLVILFAGIASAIVRSGGQRSPLALVQSAGATTSDAKTAKMSITVKAASGAVANGVTVDGAWDFEHRRGLMHMNAAQLGEPSMGTLDVIFDYSSGLVMYMKFPAQFARQFGGKQWVKLDLASLAQQSGAGVDFGALMQGGSNDPMSGLRLLRSADDVTKVGTEQVRGVETTHYRMTVKIDDALDSAPSDVRDALAQLQKATGGALPMEAWIDGDDHVRRFQMAIDSGAFDSLGAGNPYEGKVTISFDLYDFGSAVDAQPPPADQVVNFNDILKRRR